MAALALAANRSQKFANWASDNPQFAARFSAALNSVIGAVRAFLTSCAVYDEHPGDLSTSRDGIVDACKNMNTVVDSVRLPLHASPRGRKFLGRVDKFYTLLGELFSMDPTKGIPCEYVPERVRERIRRNSHIEPVIISMRMTVKSTARQRTKKTGAPPGETSASAGAASPATTNTTTTVASAISESVTNESEGADTGDEQEVFYVVPGVPRYCCRRHIGRGRDWWHRTRVDGRRWR